MSPCIGVRTSWDMTVRNCDFARSPLRAASNAFVIWFRSACRSEMTLLKLAPNSWASDITTLASLTSTRAARSPPETASAVVTKCWIGVEIRRDNHQHSKTSRQTSKKKIANAVFWEALARATSSLMGWGTITPQPVRATKVNPDIMSACIGGE